MNTLGKHAVAVNSGRHLIRVLNERRVTDGGNLCPQWLVILKLVWHGIGETLWLHAMQLVVSCSEVYFSCCCVLKRTETFASESNVTYLF